MITQGWFRGGTPASLDMINSTLARVDVRAVTPELFQPGPATPADLGDPVQYLIQHGYTQLTTYQPAGRFWPFQLIEGGWLLALSVLLIATAVWLVAPPRRVGLSFSGYRPNRRSRGSIRATVGNRTVVISALDEGIVLQGVVVRVDEAGRRSQIVHAAAAVLGRQGYGATSLKDVAREAGVAPGLLHYYFESKEDLLLEVVVVMERQMIAEWKAAIAGIDDPLERIVAGLDHAEARCAEQPEFFRLVLDLYTVEPEQPGAPAPLRRALLAPRR